MANDGVWTREWWSHNPLPYHLATPAILKKGEVGADSGNRTRTSCLEGKGTTTMQYPPNLSIPGINWKKKICNVVKGKFLPFFLLVSFKGENESVFLTYFSSQPFQITWEDNEFGSSGKRNTFLQSLPFLL